MAGISNETMNNAQDWKLFTAMGIIPQMGIMVDLLPGVASRRLTALFFLS